MKEIARKYLMCALACASPTSLSGMKNLTEISTNTWSSLQKKTSDLANKTNFCKSGNENVFAQKCTGTCNGQRVTSSNSL